MFSLKRKPRVLSEIAKFKPAYGKFKDRQGLVHTKIGEGIDMYSNEPVVILVDDNSYMKFISRKTFESKTLDIGTGFHPMFEPVNP